LPVYGEYAKIGVVYVIFNTIETRMNKNRSEVPGMTAVTVAAPEEGGEPDSPDLPSGLFHLNRAGIYLEA
jgi:hypothetical protein